VCRVFVSAAFVSRSAPGAAVSRRLDAGEALIGAARVLAPGASVILMGWSDALERPALLASADGYLPKASAPEEFVAAALAACGCKALA
jgi:hypothetical protein